jgi:hypothetical protein
VTEISRKLAAFGYLEGFGLEIMGELRQNKPSISGGNLAEREGFEPPVRFPVHLISSQAPSTGLGHLSVFGIALLCSQAYEKFT